MCRENVPLRLLALVRLLSWTSTRLRGGGVLAKHEPPLTKLARDFVIVERAKTRLQCEVKCLKDSAVEDKNVVQTSQEELIAAK